MDHKALSGGRAGWVLALCWCLVRGLAGESGAVGKGPSVPGVVIAHSPAVTKQYIGSPSLAVLPGGAYVASHDFFGPGSTEHSRARSRVHRSEDRGRSWTLASEVNGAFWSSLFVHRGDLYLLGLDRHHGDVLIRRSKDGGRTWTEPVDGRTGLLRTEGEYHCAPMPVVAHGGRLWRGFEWRHPPTNWGVHYRAGVLSVPVEADLLDARQWRATEFLASDRSWNGGDMGAWLEGNVVVTREGRLVDVLRVDTKGLPEKAAIVGLAGPEGRPVFDPATGFVEFPGGAKKFAIRWDPVAGRYWSLASVIPGEWGRTGKPSSIRNTLALTTSEDLRRWEVRCHLLHSPDKARTGFQYVDWLIEGEDLIAVCRTAFEDGQGGAHNAHDANYLTFHRFAGFRRLGLSDSVALTPAP